MDAETNKCLAAPANPIPPEPKSLRSEILTPGSMARNRLCRECLAAYRDKGTNHCRYTVAATASLRDVVEIIIHRYAPDFTADDLNSIAAVLANHLADNERTARQGEVDRLHRIAGRRLSTATLENYVVARPEQAAILAAIKDYVVNIDMRMLDGVGIVLNGPSGNGKDHLLISAARCAIQAGFTVCWKNGQDLLGEFRDRIGTDESEESLLAPLLSADVLVISDPLPPSGSLTDYQAGMIYRVLDARYRDCKATWASMNVTSRKEADNRIGVAIVDRLRHGALCLACNWPSYRKPFEAGK